MSFEAELQGIMSDKFKNKSVTKRLVGQVVGRSKATDLEKAKGCLTETGAARAAAEDIRVPSGFVFP